MIYAIAEYPWMEPPVIKIGSTVVDAEPDDPKAISSLRWRLRHLQSGNHRELAVIAASTGTLKHEKELHRKFADCRIRRGRAVCEWFEVRDAVAAWIERHRLERAIESWAERAEEYGSIFSKNKCSFCDQRGHNIQNCEAFAERDRGRKTVRKERRARQFVAAVTSPDMGSTRLVGASCTRGQADEYFAAVRGLLVTS